MTAEKNAAVQKISKMKFSKTAKDKIMRYNKPIEFQIQKEISVVEYVKLGYDRYDVLCFIKWLLAKNLIEEKQPKGRNIVFTVKADNIVGKNVVIPIIRTKKITENYFGKPSKYIENLLEVGENGEIKMNMVSQFENVDSSSSKVDFDKMSDEEKKAMFLQLKKEEQEKNLAFVAKIDNRTKIFPPRMWKNYPEVIETDIKNMQTIENPKFKLYMYENFIFASYVEEKDGVYDTFDAAFDDIWDLIEPMSYAEYHYWETTRDQLRAKFVEEGYVKILLADPPSDGLEKKVTYLAC